MKTSLQNILTRRLFTSHILLGKCGNQCLLKQRGKLAWLNCRQVPANCLAVKKHMSTVHNIRSSDVKQTHGPSVFSCFSYQQKCLSTFGPPKPAARWCSESVNFVEHENEYFHSYLKSVKEYQPYFLSCQSDQESVTLSDKEVAELLQEAEKKRKTDTFLLLLKHWSTVAKREGCRVLSNHAFSQTVTLLQKHIKFFSLEDILQSMVYLNALGLRYSTSMAEPRRNRIILSKTLDQACAQHMERMDVKDMILAADFFYSARGSSFAEFNFQMCKKAKLLLPTMTKQELILLLFHASMTRRTPTNMVQTVLHHLRQDLKSLTLQELAVVNLAHYKTQSLVKQPEYFSALTGKLKAGVNNDVDPICLSAVLKYQHRSVNRRKDQLLPQFFSTVQDIEDPVIQRMAQLSPETVMRVFSLYYSLDLLSEALFMAVVDRITHKGTQDWRLKDITKVVHILTNIPLGHESKMEALERILEDLQRGERQPEVKAHPGCLLQIAVSLTFCCLYPHWMIDSVFGPSAQKHFKESKINYRQYLYHLSQSVSIEDTLYQGPVLQPDWFPKHSKTKVYSKLAECVETFNTGGGGGITRSADDNPSSGNDFFHRDFILLDLMQALCQARPKMSPVPVFLLPHFHTADVEIQHKQGSETLQQMGSANRSDSTAARNNIREAVVLHGSNAYQTVRHCDGGTVPLLRQYHAMRARQLRTLGITVLEVPHFEFEGSSDKSLYLLAKFQQEHGRPRNS